MELGGGTGLRYRRVRPVSSSGVNGRAFAVAVGPLLAEFVVVVRAVRLLALAATLWLVAAPTCRLVRWQRGQGLDCPRYGGPLRHERAGYDSRGVSALLCVQRRREPPAL